MTSALPHLGAPVRPVGDPHAVVDAVLALTAEVFATVEVLRAGLERVFAERGAVAVADLGPIEAPVRAALELDHGPVAGAGFVAEPGALSDRPHWLEWWTVDDRRRRPVRLVVETDAGADGFRDYTLLPWFEVPRTTGRRHVTGPYVDYLCTDEYMLTFTTPVTGPAGFAGVAGADVPVRHVERLLMPLLRALPTPAALVNSGGRVVAGNRPNLFVGGLVREVPVGAIWPAGGGAGPVRHGDVVLHPCAELPLGLLLRGG